MFEGLIGFIEESVFSRINQLNENKALDALSRCEQLTGFMLVFAVLWLAVFWVELCSFF